MTPNTQKSQIYPDAGLQQLIEKKLTGLMIAHRQINSADFNCWLERRGPAIERGCELSIYMPGKNLCVSRKDATLRRAFLEAIATLERRIKRMQRETVS